MRSETSQVNILGNKVDCFKTYRQLYDTVHNDLTANSTCRGYVTVNNVHTIMEGFWNPSYQTIINRGYLSIPDGKPLEVVGKLKGNKRISRLFGPSVMEYFIDLGRKDNVSHFFLGSSEATLTKLRQAIEDKYPGVKIAGMISPPYKPVDEWDHESFVNAINAAAPDFIWIGLGAPKQEHWMCNHYKRINKGVLFGIGAGFDYLAGNTRHAPGWMKKFALEWLYRLIQEPRRLWKRYFRTIPPFILFSSLELLGIRFRKSTPHISKATITK